MTTISATQARANLYDLIDEVSQTGKSIGIRKGMEDIKKGRVVSCCRKSYYYC